MSVVFFLIRPDPEWGSVSHDFVSHDFEHFFLLHAACFAIISTQAWIPAIFDDNSCISFRREISERQKYENEREIWEHSFCGFPIAG